MRALVACSVCRTRRRKCVAQNGSNTCVYCSDRGFKCERKVPKSIVGPQISDASPSPSGDIRPSESGSPPQELSVELVELYFDLIHDQFHSLFHRPSFIEDLSQGSAPRVIILAMMALSARFSSNGAFSGQAPRERSKLYYDESVKLLDLRKSSITTIQTCILLGAISTTEGNAITESVYYTVACRMANLLDLPKKYAVDPIEREIHLRIWWTLCMVDVWSSKSVGLPRQMPYLESCPLPIDEEIFLQWRRGTEITALGGFDRKSSLLAQMILLNRVLLQVNDVIDETAASGAMNPTLEQRVQDISQQLDDWHHSLPEHMHDTPGNLVRYASQGLGRIFVAVYLGYYHFGQLLFYQFLHEDHQSASRRHYSNKCKTYAASLCSLVYAARSIPNCEVCYNMVGHVLVIASTVQIHTLLFGANEVEIRAARSRLEQNFQILIRLREYWPMLDMIFARLQVFHEVCRNSMDTSFRMDQWMLKFLSEFAEPIEEKAEERQMIGLYSVENIGFSPQDWV